MVCASVGLLSQFVHKGVCMTCASLSLLLQFVHKGVCIFPGFTVTVCTQGGVYGVCSLGLLLQFVHKGVCMVCLIICMEMVDR